MAEPEVLIVKLSDSFADSVQQLLGDAGLAGRERPGSESGPFPPAAACLVLAGGREPEALDWLTQTRAGEHLPTFVVGAAPDHRLAVGALARAARDYFALPGDLDLFRRSLERIARERSAAIAAEGFAASERDALGFDAMLGRSATLLATLAHARRVAAIKDVTVLIDRKATLFLIGTVMDYEVKAMTAGFTFTNPNEKGRCGCGESFHV